MQSSSEPAQGPPRDCGPLGEAEPGGSGGSAAGTAPALSDDRQARTDRPSPWARLAAPAHHEPRDGADPAGEDKSGPDGAAREQRQLRAQLARDVRGLAEAGAELFDGLRELVRSDSISPLIRSGVRPQPSPFELLSASVVFFASAIACSGSAESLSGAGRGRAVRAARRAVRAHRDDQERRPGRDRGRDSAATARSPKPSIKTPKTAAAIRSPAETERRDLLLQLETGELELEPCERACVLGDLLRRAPTPVSASRVGMASPIEPLGESDAGGERTPITRSGFGPPEERPRRTGAGQLCRPRRGGLRSLPAGARGDQARLELAQETGDPRRAPARASISARRSSPLGRSSSPVATRQMLDAARRAAIVAPAPSPAYKPVQNSFLSSMAFWSPCAFQKITY